MARTARRAAMAKTPTLSPSRAISGQSASDCSEARTGGAIANCVFGSLWRSRPIRKQSGSERGAALLEAAIALALTALIAAAGFSAFGAASRSSAAAEARLDALRLAENAVERASVPAFLRAALDDGEAVLAGDGWRVVAVPYAGTDQDGETESPLALVHITATAGDGPVVELETLRSAPR